MHPQPRAFAYGMAFACALLLAEVHWVQAQLVLPYVPELDDVPTAIFSYGSFIDSAVPQSFARLRVDSAFSSNRPTRDEYFMAPEAVQGKSFRGLPLAERNVDYQEIHAYTEYAFSPIVSVFLDVPQRFLNPDFNKDQTGIGDLQFGVKYSFYQQGPLTATLQFRGYVPTGDERLGLGIGHSAIEPGFLAMYQPIPTWRIEGEFLTWIPVNDQKYGGEVLRYGVGTSYGERSCDSFWLTPVGEFQGWTSVRGKETVAVSPKKSPILPAVGDSIVNANVGIRAGWGTLGDLFLGYSRALTGDVWYKNLYRLEFRYFY